MIRKVESFKELKKFIFFIKDLYGKDTLQVYPIFYALKKELKREVLIKKRYTAILCLQNNKIAGRLLYTVDKSKNEKRDICYYSFFDCIDDISVAKELFSYMENDMKGKAIDYFEGTYTPYDPDTRRGVLVKGFDMPPTIFTSYNYEYYQRLIEACGYEKAYDTYSLELNLHEKNKQTLQELSAKIGMKFDISVDSLDFKNFDRDIEDVGKILNAATDELVYQEAPSVELIRKTAKSMKLFLNPNLVKIAREKKTGRPVGFCLVLPDFNEILKETGGKIRPLKFVFGKKKITSARGTMQYIIPEYQGAGVIALIFNEMYNSFEKEGIKYFEGGTILEHNQRSWKVLQRFGGEIVKIYRIYGKKV